MSGKDKTTNLFSPKLSWFLHNTHSVLGIYL